MLNVAERGENISGDPAQYIIQVGAAPPLVPLVRVELHSLGLGVSVSPLVPLVNVELHLLGS